jgi:hypothetical protein
VFDHPPREFRRQRQAAGFALLGNSGRCRRLEGVEFGFDRGEVGQGGLLEQVPLFRGKPFTPGGEAPAPVQGQFMGQLLDVDLAEGEFRQGVNAPWRECPLQDSNDPAVAEVLPGQAQNEGVELAPGQTHRLGASAGPDAMALVQPPHRQPHAEAIVNEDLDPVGPAVGEEVRLMGRAAPNTLTTWASRDSIPARRSWGAAASHTASTRIIAATRATRRRRRPPPTPAR